MRRIVGRQSVLGVIAVGSMLMFSACGGSDDSATAEDEATAGEQAGGGELSGDISIDGSSTVAPLSEPAAEAFMAENPDVRISVGTSGTGGGFEKFCNEELDIADASRHISDEEIAACEDAGITYEEIPVANDGLAVIVNPENDWVQCMSVDELSQIWTRDSEVESWSDVSDEFPDETVDLYGPGSDSGTFDFFTEAINGEEGVIRTDYNNIGEDDNAAITGVAGGTGAMAFVPLSYVQEAGDTVRTIEVENESGDCVAPTLETVQSGDYNPLGRQLFVYPSGDAVEREEVKSFLQFYIENGDEIAEAANFIPLTDEQKEGAQAQIEELVGN